MWTISLCFNIMEIIMQVNEYTAKNKDFKDDGSINLKHSDWISLTVVIIFLVMCFQPSKWFQPAARYELLYTISQIVIAPFGHVRFKDFFLADVITSMGSPIVDMGISAAYFGSGKFGNRDSDVSKKEGVLKWWVIAFAYLPYWWRYWQCINKWRNQNNKMQFINSLKYASKFGPPTCYFIFGAANKVDTGHTSFWAFFVAQMITTLFCLYWDFRWDWGFFIGSKDDTKYLRDQLIFSKRFYYTCMVFNTIFRFWWLIGIFTIKTSVFWDSIGILTFCSMLVEAMRRTFWAIIRVENEFFNNFEQYRDIVMIPPIKELDENQN